MDIVKAKATLDTEPFLIGRTVPAFRIQDLVIADLEGQLTTNAAERTHTVNLAVDPRIADHGFLQQRARWAGLHTFTAANAGALPHGIIKIKDNLRAHSAAGHADHVIDLHIAAGTDAEITVDAGIQIDRHGRMRQIIDGHVPGCKPAIGDLLLIGHLPEVAICIIGGGAIRLIGDEQFHHHFPGPGWPVGGRIDHHALGRCSNTAGHQDALAFNFDHAGAAVAVCFKPNPIRVTEMRNFCARALRHVPNRVGCGRGNTLAVQFKGDQLTHCTSSAKCLRIDNKPLGAA